MFDVNGVEKLAVLDRDSRVRIYPLPSVDVPEVSAERTIVLPEADTNFYTHRDLDIANGNIYTYSEDGRSSSNMPRRVVHVVPLDGSTPTSFTISYDDLPHIHTIIDEHFFVTTDLLFIVDSERVDYFRAIDFEGNNRPKHTLSLIHI